MLKLSNFIGNIILSMSILIKPSSLNYNLKYKYYFYDDVDDSKEVVNNGFMSIDTAH